MKNAVETERLFRRFGRTEAVRDLTLEVPEGSIYAFLGPNGAGKTTTIKILMNILQPSSGRTAALGTDSRRLRPVDLAQIGYVSENQSLPAWMTTEQLLSFCKPFYPSWDDDFCRKLIEKFDLPVRSKIKTFSRGMKMKIAMVAALAYHPRLLVLDEPFGGLDPLVRDELVSGMLELTGEGEWTIFVSSHDISEIENLADRVGFIRRGRLVLSEQLSTLQERFREIEVILGEPAKIPDIRPDTWLLPQADGRVVRFVDSRYGNERSANAIREFFPADARVSASPMSLRKIFLSLARVSPGKDVGA